MNIFNIGKANARITELETELAAAKDNAKTVEAAAEKSAGELSAANARAEKAEKALAAANERATTAEAEAKTAKAAVADFDAKVEAAAKMKAAAQAAVIVAGTGVPPVAGKAAENPGTESKPELKGRARFAAAVKIVG